MPFEEALDLAAEFGVKYIWHLCNGELSGMAEDKAIVDMTVAEIDAMQGQLKSRDREFVLLLNRPHFKGSTWRISTWTWTSWSRRFRW